MLSGGFSASASRLPQVIVVEGLPSQKESEGVARLPQVIVDDGLPSWMLSGGLLLVVVSRPQMISEVGGVS